LQTATVIHWPHRINGILCAGKRGIAMNSFFGACGFFGILIPLFSIISFICALTFRLSATSSQSIRTLTILCVSPLLLGIVGTCLNYVTLPALLIAANSPEARTMKDIYMSRMWYPIYLGAACALLPTVVFVIRLILGRPKAQPHGAE
jgi:hypothetical protein